MVKLLKICSCLRIKQHDIVTRFVSRNPYGIYKRNYA